MNTRAHMMRQCVASTAETWGELTAGPGPVLFTHTPQRPHGPLAKDHLTCCLSTWETEKPFRRQQPTISSRAQRSLGTWAARTTREERLWLEAFLPACVPAGLAATQIGSTIFFSLIWHLTVASSSQFILKRQNCFLLHLLDKQGISVSTTTLIQM